MCKNTLFPGLRRNLEVLLFCTQIARIEHGGSIQVQSSPDGSLDRLRHIAITYPKQTELLSSVDQLRNKGVMHRIKRQKKRTNSRLLSFVKFSLFITVQYLHSYLYSSIWLSQSHCYSALLISARYVSARLARSVPGKLSITCA